MPQTWLDDDAHKILKSVQEQMKENGHRGATLGDAVRQLQRESIKQDDASPKEAAIEIAA